MALCHALRICAQPTRHQTVTALSYRAITFARKNDDGGCFERNTKQTIRHISNEWRAASVDRH
jgi:hypothetical protein